MLTCVLVDLVVTGLKLAQTTKINIEIENQNKLFIFSTVMSNRNSVRKPWTLEEDTLLSQLVSEHGAMGFW